MEITQEMIDNALKSAKEDVYNSAAYNAFLKAKAEFDTTRLELFREIDGILTFIDEDFYEKIDQMEDVEERRAYAKEFYKAQMFLQEVRDETGYNCEGYDMLEEAWNSSSFHC